MKSQILGLGPKVHWSFRTLCQVMAQEGCIYCGAETESERTSKGSKEGGVTFSVPRTYTQWIHVNVGVLNWAFISPIKNGLYFLFIFWFITKILLRVDKIISTLFENEMIQKSCCMITYWIFCQKTHQKNIYRWIIELFCDMNKDQENN